MLFLKNNRFQALVQSNKLLYRNLPLMCDCHVLFSGGTVAVTRTTYTLLWRQPIWTSNKMFCCHCATRKYTRWAKNTSFSKACNSCIWRHTNAFYTSNIQFSVWPTITTFFD